MHFVYDGDDTLFRHRYAIALAEHGHSNLEDVLADVKAQRWKRLRDPIDAAVRQAKIAKEYKPMHPRVYTLDSSAFLAPGFVELVASLQSVGDQTCCLGDCIASLKERGLLS